MLQLRSPQAATETQRNQINIYKKKKTFNSCPPGRRARPASSKTVRDPVTGLVLATHLHRCRGHLPPHPLPARTPSGPRSWLHSDPGLVSVGPLAPAVPHKATSPTSHEDSHGTAARGRRATPLFTSPTHRALPLPNATPTPCTETQIHVFQEGPQRPQRPTCS